MKKLNLEEMKKITGLRADARCAPGAICDNGFCLWDLGDGYYWTDGTTCF